MAEPQPQHASGRRLGWQPGEGADGDSDADYVDYVDPGVEAADDGDSETSGDASADELKDEPDEDGEEGVEAQVAAKPRRLAAPVLSIVLKHGDVLVMAGAGIQRDYPVRPRSASCFDRRSTAPNAQARGSR